MSAPHAAGTGTEAVIELSSGSDSETPPSEADSSDQFGERNSEISDSGDSEPDDGESLGSETAPSEADSSEADQFEERNSEISDSGDSEPDDGESLGSEDSESSSEGSDSGSTESEEESVVYETEQEDELDRLDAKADEMEAARACKRRRMA
jgi:hypothetical protein